MSKETINKEQYWRQQYYPKNEQLSTFPFSYQNSNKIIKIKIYCTHLIELTYNIYIYIIGRNKNK